MSVNEEGAVINGRRHINPWSVETDHLQGPPSIGMLDFKISQKSIPFAEGSDPDIFHKRHFADGKYRVIKADGAEGTTPKYKTSDFENFTKEESDILPEISTGGGTNEQDHVMIEGDFVLYISVNDTSTDVYRGSELTSESLEKVGEVFPGRSDVGVFYEEENNKVHIYPQDPDEAEGYDSNVLEHHTTPATDLLNATYQSDILDLTSKAWVTGDPDVVKYGDYYYMFIDKGKSPYYLALLSSVDLYNWTLVDDQFTYGDQYGGDLAVTQFGDKFRGMTEFSGPSATDIAVWDILPITSREHINPDSVLPSSVDPSYPIVADFESQSKSYLRVIKGSPVARDTTKSLEGTASLRTDGTDGSQVETNLITKRGFVYRAPIFLTTSVNNTSKMGLGFMTSPDKYLNSNSGYIFKVRAEVGDIIVIRRDSGDITILDNPSATIPTGEWLVIEVVYDYDELVLNLYDLTGTNIVSASANDQTYPDAEYLLINMYNNESGQQDYLDCITRKPIIWSGK